MYAAIKNVHVLIYLFSPRTARGIIVRANARDKNKQCRTNMAIVRWAPGIASVSGKLSGTKKGDQHSCDSFMIATHRVAETTNPNCNRIYMRNPVERSTPPTQLELQQRAKFAQLAQAVADRSQDLSKVSQDQAAYLAQKDQPGGKTTFKSYLWAVCKAELENA